MHEYGIAQHMVTVALQHAQKHDARHITQFSIQMNRNADESEDALRFYLEELTRGTCAEGARFEIKPMPVRIRCLECGAEFPPDYLGMTCPQCFAARIASDQQDEFKLASIEIE